jgi:hypothetical protein
VQKGWESIKAGYTYPGTAYNFARILR